MKKAYADMDPLEEIRAIREEISREFKSVLALGEYLQQNPDINSPKEPTRRKVRKVVKAGV